MCSDVPSWQKRNYTFHHLQQIYQSQFTVVKYHFIKLVRILVSTSDPCFMQCSCSDARWFCLDNQTRHNIRSVMLIAVTWEYHVAELPNLSERDLFFRVDI